MKKVWGCLRRRRRRRFLEWMGHRTWPTVDAAERDFAELNASFFVLLFFCLLLNC